MAKGETYEEFIEKFKPKKTTDDCYTPEPIYDALIGWLRGKTGRPLTDEVIRPFYPGGDYKNAKYPPGCCVVDNPPFSILAEIVRFYKDRDIPFLLFCDGKSAFDKLTNGIQLVLTGVSITYGNGASVYSSFITNMLTREEHILVDPKLNICLREANKRKEPKKITLNKYPDDFACFATLGAFARRDCHIAISEEEIESRHNHLYDEQGKKVSVFGGGFKLRHPLPPPLITKKRFLKYEDR